MAGIQGFVGAYADLVTVSGKIPGDLFYAANGPSAYRLTYVGKRFDFLVNFDLIGSLPGSFSTDFPTATLLGSIYTDWSVG